MHLKEHHTFLAETRLNKLKMVVLPLALKGQLLISSGLDAFQEKVMGFSPSPVFIVYGIIICISRKSH